MRYSWENVYIIEMFYSSSSRSPYIPKRGRDINWVIEIFIVILDEPLPQSFFFFFLKILEQQRERLVRIYLS
jgi:hypothetical protein